MGIHGYFEENSQFQSAVYTSRFSGKGYLWPLDIKVMDAPSIMMRLEMSNKSYNYEILRIPYSFSLELFPVMAGPGKPAPAAYWRSSE